MYKFSSKFLCAYVVCTSVLNILVQSGCMFFYKTMLQLHKHPKHKYLHLKVGKTVGIAAWDEKKPFRANFTLLSTHTQYRVRQALAYPNRRRIEKFVCRLLSDSVELCFCASLIITKTKSSQIKSK